LRGAKEKKKRGGAGVEKGCTPNLFTETETSSSWRARKKKIRKKVCDTAHHNKEKGDRKKRGWNGMQKRGEKGRARVR